MTTNRKNIRAEFHDYSGGDYFVTVCTSNKEHYLVKILRSSNMIQTIESKRNGRDARFVRPNVPGCTNLTTTGYTSMLPTGRTSMLPTGRTSRASLHNILNTNIVMGGYFDAEGNAYYYLTDYQGNITGVIDSNARVVQETGYYPYGEPWLEPEGDNPYLYGGKERVALGGVRYSDFGPRLLSTASGYWGSPDPLCEDYRDLSPYINCAANPVRYSDPSGLSPVYNINGDILGCTKEGFTGDILIYVGEEKINPADYTADELLSKNEVNFYDIYADPKSEDMSDEAHSKILTSVVSHFEGMEVLGEKFSMSKLRRGRIRYEKGDFNWQTRYYESGPAGIFNSGIKGYEATVENIASSVIVHEWYSHIIEGVDDKTNNHSKAYFNVIYNNSLWEKTTEEYKEFNKDKFIEYLRHDVEFYQRKQ